MTDNVVGIFGQPVKPPVEKKEPTSEERQEVAKKALDIVRGLVEDGALEDFIIIGRGLKSETRQTEIFYVHTPGVGQEHHYEFLGLMDTAKASIMENKLLYFIEDDQDIDYEDE